MSFATNEIQQISINDSMNQLTDRELKRFERSWSKTFAEIMFPAIDERPFSILYSERPSRSNTPINIIVGSLILKETFGLTDVEIVDALMYDVRFQYALHTTSSEEQPLNDRTLGRFRARCLSYEEETGIDLIHDCIVDLSKEIATFMNIRSRTQRMDSLMVASNIKKMSRLELIYTCVSNLVNVVDSQDHDNLPTELTHYCDSDDHNMVIYHNHSEETDSKITGVLKDASTVIKFCEDQYDETDEYKLLQRVLNEQTTTVDGNNYELKDKGSVGMDSKILQNPADPDATYCKKAGKENRGYIANVIEDVGEDTSIVSEYQYEENVYSDSQFAKDYIENLQPAEDETLLVTDGGYSGSENVDLAKEKNVRLITTDLKGVDANDLWADFEFSEDGKTLLHCANGNVPKSCTYNSNDGKCRISFHREQCMGCPYKDQCKPKIFKRVAHVNLSAKTVNRAKLQRVMSTEQFKGYGRFRNGVEAIPSLLRRKFTVDKIPVRGKLRSKLFFGFKIAALNANKLFKYADDLRKLANEAIIA